MVSKASDIFKKLYTQFRNNYNIVSKNIQFFEALIVGLLFALIGNFICTFLYEEIIKHLPFNIKWIIWWIFVFIFVGLLVIVYIKLKWNYAERNELKKLCAEAKKASGI